MTLVKIRLVDDVDYLSVGLETTTDKVAAGAARVKDHLVYELTMAKLQGYSLKAILLAIILTAIVVAIPEHLLGM